MQRTTFSDLGYRPRRVRLLLLEAEWRKLEDEADRRGAPLGTTISAILGLTIANREDVDSITQQCRDDSAARSKGGPVR